MINIVDKQSYNARRAGVKILLLIGKQFLMKRKRLCLVLITKHSLLLIAKPERQLSFSF